MSRFKGKLIGLVAPFNGEHHYAHLIKKTMEEMGMIVVGFDYRMERNWPEEISLGDYDAVVVIRGEGIPPEVIRDIKAPTILWYGEYFWGDCEAALARRKEIEYNSSAFDYVRLSAGFEEKALKMFSEISGKNVGAVYPLRLTPDLFKYHSIKKRCDISFIGTLTERRKHTLSVLSEYFTVHYFNQYNLREQVRIINQSKMNVHMHFADYKCDNTVNMKVLDILSCEGFCLNEKTANPTMFVPGKHLIEFDPNDEKEMIEIFGKWLADDDGRRKIGVAGRRHLIENYSMEGTVESLIGAVFDA